MSAESPALGRESRRVIIASMVGTTIEWYDFFIYAICAGLVFSSQFFATIGGDDALIVSFATIGLTFLFWPIALVLAVHLVYKIGRRAMLILTLLLIEISTVLILFVPSAATMGIAEH